MDGPRKAPRMLNRNSQSSQRDSQPKYPLRIVPSSSGTRAHRRAIHNRQGEARLVSCAVPQKARPRSVSAETFNQNGALIPVRPRARDPPRRSPIP